MEEQKKRFYYGADGVIEVTPFFDSEPEANGRDYVELTYEEWCDQLQCCLLHYRKAYRDGGIVEEPVPEEIPEIEEEARISAIGAAKRRLADTDYVVSKINEAAIDGEEARQKAIDEYKEVLEERKALRLKINELEAESAAYRQAKGSD